MPKIKLTERVVEKLKAPDPSGKQVLHWDEELKGFGVLCSGATSSKSYVVQRTLRDGRNRRVTVAAVNEMSLVDARNDAAEMLVAMRRGEDPKKRGRETTLQKALDTYLNTNRSLAEKTKHDYRTNVETYLKTWLNHPLSSITREDVEKRHAAIAKEVKAKWRNPETGESRYNGQNQANSVMRVLRLIWNDAEDRDNTLPQNPVRLRKQWYEEKRRERLVSVEELPIFYKAVCDLKSAVARDYLLLLLFTGMRRTEAATLTWDDIDFKERVIRIPADRTKARRKLDLPMVDLVHDMLVVRRGIGKESFVFPSTGKSGHIAEPKFPLDEVKKTCGVQVSAHDLRRTYITVAESADISPLALKALVNHSLGKGVTEGYVVTTAERLRQPAQRVANKMKELCGIEAPEGSNVTPLAAAVEIT